MAQLAAKAYLVASLNIMVAARQSQGSEQAFRVDEIIQILLAMAESSLVTAEAYSTPKATWHSRPKDQL